MNQRKPAVPTAVEPEITSPDSQAKNSKRSSLGRKAGRALFWNVAFLPIKAGLALFVSLVIVKLFPSESYAALAAVQAVLSTLGLYVDLGIERALPRFVSEIEKREGRPALRLFITRITIIKLAVLAAVVVAMTFAAETIAGWMGWGEQGHIYLALISLLLVLGALYDICTQVLYSFFKQKVTNLLDIVVTVVNPLMTLLLIGPVGLRVYGVVLALLFTTIISVLIATWQAWLATRSHSPKPKVQNPVPLPTTNNQQPTTLLTTRNSQLATPVQPTTDHRPPTTPRESIVKRFVRYSALMYFFNISAWFYDAPFAVLVFTFYKEFITVGLIKLIYNFIKMLLKNLLAPFVGVQTPLFSSIHAEGQTDKLHAAYASISKLQIFILVPSGIGAIILARNLLELLFISNKSDAVLHANMIDAATWATILTILFTFVEALISLPMVILMVYERYRDVILARTLPLLAGPLLVLLAVFHFDIIAAVTVMGLMAVGSRIMAMVALQRTLGLYYPVKFLVKVLKAALAFGVPLQTIVLFLPINWPVTLVIAGAGVLIFYAVFKGLGGFDLEDKNRLQTLNMPLRKYIVKWL